MWRGATDGKPVVQSRFGPQNAWRAVGIDGVPSCTASITWELQGIDVERLQQPHDLQSSRDMCQLDMLYS